MTSVTGYVHLLHTIPQVLPIHLRIAILLYIILAVLGYKTMFNKAITI